MLELLNDLGLDQNTKYSAEELKKAWRQKCNESHPDKQGGSNEKFLKVMHAYKMLTDLEYRNENADKDKKIDLVLRMQIPVEFDVAFFGKSFRVSYNRLNFGEDGKPIHKEEQDVVYLDLICKPGQKPQDIEVFGGKGHRSGEDFGDCQVSFIAQRHPIFQLEGIDIVSRQNVELDMLLRGGEIEILTMYGLHTLRIPPGTKPNDRLVIKNKGVSKVGHHYVVIDVVYPSKDDLKKKEAWKGLDINWPKEEEEVRVDPNEALFEQLRRNGFFVLRG